MAAMEGLNNKSYGLQNCAFLHGVEIAKAELQASERHERLDRCHLGAFEHVVFWCEQSRDWDAVSGGSTI